MPVTGMVVKTVRTVLPEVTVVPAVTMVPALLVVTLVSGSILVLSSSPQPRCHEGSSTGVRNTMMQTTATRQPPAIASNLRLRSIAPRRIARKNPLSRKNKTMLTELFTSSGYQNQTRAGTGRTDALRGPAETSAGAIVNTTTGCIGSDVLAPGATATFSIYVDDPNNEASRAVVAVESTYSSSIIGLQRRRRATPTVRNKTAPLSKGCRAGDAISSAVTWSLYP